MKWVLKLGLQHLWLGKISKGGFSIIPAKAVIQISQGLLDPGFRRGGGLEALLLDLQCSMINEGWSLR